MQLKSLKVLPWGFDEAPHVLGLAVRYGHVDIVKWLYEEGFVKVKDVLDDNWDFVQVPTAMLMEWWRHDGRGQAWTRDEACPRETPMDWPWQCCGRRAFCGDYAWDGGLRHMVYQPHYHIEEVEVERVAGAYGWDGCPSWGEEGGKAWEWEWKGGLSEGWFPVRRITGGGFGVAGRKV